MRDRSSSRRRRIRTRRREVGAALGAALLLGGCGSGTEDRAAPRPPRLPRAVAAQLAIRSDEVARLLARSDGCGALDAAKRLQRDAIAAVNARRVAARFQEPLLGAANDLVLRIHCAPPPAPPPVTTNDEGEHGKPKDHKEHGKGHGKGKHHGGDE